MPSVKKSKIVQQAKAWKPKPKQSFVSYTYEQHPQNWYQEDAWVSERLFEEVEFSASTIIDPFCGGGNILKAARVHFKSPHGPNSPPTKQILGRDLVDRGAGEHCHSINPEGGFFILDTIKNPGLLFDWPYWNIVSNPPYGDDIDTLLKLMFTQGLAAKCAFFLPMQYLAGKAKLLSKLPLAEVLVCTPRPNCLPGELIKQGQAPQGGKRDFAWFVFDPDAIPGIWQTRYLFKKKPQQIEYKNVTLSAGPIVGTVTGHWESMIPNAEEIAKVIKPNPPISLPYVHGKPKQFSYNLSDGKEEPMSQEALMDDLKDAINALDLESLLVVADMIEDRIKECGSDPEIESEDEEILGHIKPYLDALKEEGVTLLVNYLAQEKHVLIGDFHGSAEKNKTTMVIQLDTKEFTESMNTLTNHLVDLSAQLKDAVITSKETPDGSPLYKKVQKSTYGDPSKFEKLDADGD